MKVNENLFKFSVETQSLDYYKYFLSNFKIKFFGFSKDGDMQLKISN